MKINCVWEHNGRDSLIYAIDLPGAYARGASREAAMAKMEREAASYLRWAGAPLPEEICPEIVQEKDSALEIRDADSDVLFAQERLTLTLEEYTALKRLALKSAEDFLALYRAVPDPRQSCLPRRNTFYGPVPRTAEEMYAHTKNVNSYYFGEIEVDADNEGDILDCRRRGFCRLEAKPDFLSSPVFDGSYGEEWSVRKVLRRFLWHDRIHARAMYRMAVKTFGPEKIPDVFCFGQQREI